MVFELQLLRAAEDEWVKRLGERTLFDEPVMYDTPWEFRLIAAIIGQALTDAFAPETAAANTSSSPTVEQQAEAKAFFEDGRIEVYAGMLGLSAETVFGIAGHVIDHGLREGMKLAA